MVYIISYDLGKPTQRYNELAGRIRQYPSWAWLGQSVYLIETNSTAVEIRDNLKEFIDGNDKLFVGKIGAPAAWKGYSEDISNWIKLKLK